ncbi:MAG: coenzyme F420-reducing hydrogenase, FrhD protein [Methanobacterium sp.]
MPYDAEILVVGCGNVLFEDDGFGPAVIGAIQEHFKDKELPENTMFIDAGTSAPHFIFSLPDESWKKLIVVDVVDSGVEPGTVRRFEVTELPRGRYDDAHSWSVEEPLHELSKTIDVFVIGCQPESISAPDVKMGLTKSVEEAVPKAIKVILREIGV